MNNKEPHKDFVIALNYAFKYGSYDPNDKEMEKKAYAEFGKFADKLLAGNCFINYL